jgi:predicted dehydrogenase
VRGRFGGTPFADYREIVEKTRPEFLIALGRHCDMPQIFRLLVRAGVPFIIEKPWGTDADAVADLARLAVEGRWVGVPFMARYSFWVATVKRLIEAQEFGKISHIYLCRIRPTMQRYVEWDSPWTSDKSPAGDGALLNLGGHGFDMARFGRGRLPHPRPSGANSPPHRRRGSPQAGEWRPHFASRATLRCRPDSAVEKTRPWVILPASPL